MRPAVVATALVSLATVGVLAGCPDRSISEVKPVQGRVEANDFPIKVNRDVDILFVIDDSPSMGDKQANLARNFDKFITVLSSLEGGLPNVHLGVVTSDVGSRGANGTLAPGIGSLGQGGCANAGKRGELQLFGAPVSNGPYISDIQPADTSLPRSRNYSGELVDAFRTMAKAGAGGCGFEQHLEAMKLALQPTNAVNQGFLRRNAFLAVVFIADEDDCSMEDAVGLLGPETPALGPQQSFRCTRFGVTCDDNGTTPTQMNTVGGKDRCHPNEDSPYLTKVKGYVDFLKGLKDDPGMVIVAGIMGTNEPFATELRAPPKMTTKIPALAHSCTYVGADGAAEVADPPIRLRFFLDQFPNRSTFAPICQADLSGGLQQIGDLLKTVIGDPCIEGKLADADPNTAGTQYDCSVSSVTNPNTATRKEEILPRCMPESAAATNTPCWHLVVDINKCPDPDTEHYTLKIEGEDKLLENAHIVANCVTEVVDN